MAGAIKTNGALTKLNMAANALLTKQAGKVLADMLKANSGLKELDVSNSGQGLRRSDKDGPGFAQEIAAGVSANGALTVLDISNNNLAQAKEPLYSDGDHKE